MAVMKIRDECRDCLVKLVDLTVTAATVDDQLRARAKEAALAIIGEEFAPDAIPALIASRFHRAIWEITGNQDPFAGRKAAETKLLARLAAKVAAHYPEDLEPLLKLAVLGNTVDFFRAEAEVIQEMQQGVEFAISAVPRLRHRLASTPGVLLYLADNAGEQFFDRPLVAWLRRRGWQVFYVVKGGPIQNDLTKADLAASGLLAALEPVVDTGSRTVGLLPEAASPAFRRLYQEADIIMAKGMGHFETMSQLNDPRIFFLLQAKCRPVAHALGVSLRSFVLAPGV